MVALFVLVGVAALGWLVFKFGDLPALVTEYRSKEVWAYVPDAGGVRVNAPVIFKGFSVGRVANVEPPALMKNLQGPGESYQVAMKLVLSKDYQIPANVVPRIYRRGLGSSYVELSLETEPSGQLLQEGAKLQGGMAGTAEFIPQSVQQKIEDLAVSVKSLSDTIRGQLETRTPEMVAANAQLPPNVTTAIIRLDRVLTNLNTIMGDQENQGNIKRGLANFSEMTEQIRLTAKAVQDLTDDAQGLIQKTSGTVANIEKIAVDTNANIAQLSGRIQTAADRLSTALTNLDGLFSQIRQGEGTMGRLMNDPRLYQSLEDAGRNLSQALAEFRELVAQWKQKGVQVKMK